MKFRKLLIKLSKQGKHPRYHHAAVVAKGNSIFGVGVNQPFGRHAEVAALEAAGCSVKGATLYTLMTRRDGSLGNGSPCAECMEEITNARIRRVVVYTDDRIN